MKSLWIITVQNQLYFCREKQQHLMYIHNVQVYFTDNIYYIQMKEASYACHTEK